MYVYMYIYICVYMCVSVCVCAYVCVCLTINTMCVSTSLWGAMGNGY